MKSILEDCGKVSRSLEEPYAIRVPHLGPNHIDISSLDNSVE
jgi:hypothetical protein